jgi:hypothetical protein
MMIWNGYFDFELDHCSKNVVLEFRNAANAVISSYPTQLPIATENDLTADVVDLPAEVLGVRSVIVRVNTLWGGNEISLRRIAFAGHGLSTGLAELSDMDVMPAYPQPAFDRVTLPLAGIRSVVVLDDLGRVVRAEVHISSDRAEVSCAGVTAGLYHALVTTAEGVRRYRLVLGVN